MRFAKVCVAMATLALVVAVGAYLATALALVAVGDGTTRSSVELVDASGSSAPVPGSWRTETGVGEGIAVGASLADDFARAWWEMSGMTAGRLLTAAAIGAGVVVVGLGCSALVRRLAARLA